VTLFDYPSMTKHFNSFGHTMVADLCHVKLSLREASGEYTKIRQSGDRHITVFFSVFRLAPLGAKVRQVVDIVVFSCFRPVPRAAKV
jgi:hypothetical protein